MNSFYRRVGMIRGTTWATNLVAEAEASKEAVKLAYKVGGKAHAKKMAKLLVAPYMTYVGAAAFTGAGISAAIKYLRGRRKER